MRPLLLAVLFAQSAGPTFEWRDLPPLLRGVGGAHAGVLDGKLVVAGGSWWTAPPGAKGEKKFESAILTLERGAAQWKRAGALPEGLAYGAVAGLATPLIIIGGQTAAGFSSKVWILRPNEMAIKAQPGTPLPLPLANAAAAALNNRVYVFGGQWREEAPLPGRPRFFPQASSCGDRIFFAGGTDLKGHPPTRVFLHDAWTFSPSTGWKPIAPLPRPAQAGIGICEAGQFYVHGGNAGAFSGRDAELGDHRPGFTARVIAGRPHH